VTQNPLTVPPATASAPSAPAAAVVTQIGPGAESVLGAALAAVVACPVPAARRWWVTVERTQIEVHAAGAPHVATPVGAATRVWAGAAVFAARLAVAVSGFRPVTTLLPVGVPRSVVAIVRRGAAAPPTRAEQLLFAALLARPGPHGRPPVPPAAARAHLRGACDAEGVRSRTAVTPEERGRLRALLPAVPDPPEEGLLLLLGTDHDLPISGLRAGQGLQRVMCTASALGARGAVLAGPVELAQIGVPGRAGAGLGLVPQVLVHVGVPPAVVDGSPDTGSEGPAPGDRSHCRRPVRAGEPREQELEEGTP
jgi:hypothetical protein